MTNDEHIEALTHLLETAIGALYLLSENPDSDVADRTANELDAELRALEES